MFDASHIVQSGGLLLLGIFLFAEVGLFLGFFLPGDTLLISAGIFAKQGKLSLAGILIVGAIAAILGDNTAYFIGRKYGRRIFTKDRPWALDPSHIDRAEKFYNRYGTKAVLVAHFLPVVRTFTPLLGGVAKMPYRTFFSFDAIGDITWAVSLTLVGYYLGSRIPNIDHYILFIVVVVVISSASPTIYHIIKSRRKKKKAETKET